MAEENVRQNEQAKVTKPCNCESTDHPTKPTTTLGIGGGPVSDNDRGHRQDRVNAR